MPSNRRHFLQSTLGLAASLNLPDAGAEKKPKLPFPISCNQYSWFTFFRRDGRDWKADLDVSIGEYVKSGFQAFEPSFESVEEVEKLAPVVKKYGVVVPSLYVNSVLHDADEAKKSLGKALDIAKSAKKLLGTKIVVTNPSPLNWNGPELKSDPQLVEQAKNLDFLGQELRKLGMTLSYHTHDMEMRAGAREFHHMMQNTDPANVTFCMDVHWIYRGSGNSQLAVFDVLKLYGKRITEMHIRQSKDGIWTEVFEEKGDIDYGRLANELNKMGIRPHIVMEQCLEKQSPDNHNAIDAHRQDLTRVRETFKILMN